MAQIGSKDIKKTGTTNITEHRINLQLWEKIFETNSCFHVKSSISIFQDFLNSIEKTLILGGRLSSRL